MMQIYSINLGNVWFGLACAKQHIYATYFGENQQTVIRGLMRTLPFDAQFEVCTEPSEFARDALLVLQSVYVGQSQKSSLPLALEHLPAYTQQVLKATKQIPFGYLSSYGAIADAVGGGPRAVGNIMANNPFSPYVPCHRVVKSDFTLGGYSGGLKIKYQLLSREKCGFTGERFVDVDGGQLQVFPVEFTLKKVEKLFLP
jgi:O-6-methylguanine DNA methyltransferase